MELNKLVQYLGGKDNILDTEVNMSRLKVTLKDVSIVDKNAIEKLGYVPSNIARGLAKSKTTNVAIVLPSPNYSYIHNILAYDCHNTMMHSH